MLRPRSVLLPLGLCVCLLSRSVFAGHHHTPPADSSDAAGTLTLGSASTTTFATTTNAGTQTLATNFTGVNTYTGAGSYVLGNGFLSANGAALAVAPYTQIIVFGDSLSDTGNFASASEDTSGGLVTYPSNDFNYAEGRFTNDTGTSPAAKKYAGVWHEQLARLFLGMTAAKASTDGGTDYAYGDAETYDGQRDVSITTSVDVHVDNLNRQATNYLTGHTPDADALYIVWAGSNDLFEDGSLANADGAADRETLVIRRLAEAGAKTFLLPNVPPLGLTPEYSGDASLSAALNAAASEFRTHYSANLDALEATLAQEGYTVKFYRLDIFDLFNRLTGTNGAAYGFTNITDSAQDASVKADQYLFWDNVHPTTYGHFQIAAEAFTLLTGTPVVEVSQVAKTVDRNGTTPDAFLFTRTGTDLTTPIPLHYTVGGSAVPGTDYAALKGKKMIKSGKRTVMVPVAPVAATGAAKLTLTLEAGNGFVLPVVPTATIKLSPNPQR